MLRHRSIAPHKRRSGGMGVKGLAEGLPFHKPVGVKGSVEKHPFHKPMRQRWHGERVIEKPPFHKPMRQRAVCAKRSANGDPMLHLGCAHGGAHCKTVCTRAVSYPLAMPLARGLRFGVAIGRCHWSAFGEGPRASAPALRHPEDSTPMEKPSTYPWIVRTQFSSARPVRAPKEEQCFAHGNRTAQTPR